MTKQLAKRLTESCDGQLYVWRFEKFRVSTALKRLQREGRGFKFPKIRSKNVQEGKIPSNFSENQTCPLLQFDLRFADRSTNRPLRKKIQYSHHQRLIPFSDLR